MDVPRLVADALGDEEVVAHLSLKGEDAIYVTGTRTIRYTSEGLLSDESASEYPHDAERVDVEEKRRKANILLDYGTDGQDGFSVPASKLEEALHPVLAGVLHAAGVTGPGETVKRTFRFSELTLVVTSERLVKHVGSSVWDAEYDEVPYDAVSGFDVEEGNVSSQLVITTSDRIERIKAPNESFRLVEETVREALLDHYGVDSLEEFEEMVATEEPEDETTGGPERNEVSFDAGVDPIQTGSTDDSDEEATAESAQTTSATAGSTGADELEESGFTSAATKVQSKIDPDELRAELDEMEALLETQAEAIEEQQKRIEEMRHLIEDS
ncbi:MAG: hypothetical protein ABEJ58_05285 [Halodesulfurarchaeum sp.]